VYHIVGAAHLRDEDHVAVLALAAPASSAMEKNKQVMKHIKQAVKITSSHGAAPQP
jgi:hypothetical protein